jgi:hypothetical protein
LVDTLYSNLFWLVHAPTIRFANQKSVKIEVNFQFNLNHIKLYPYFLCK